MLQAFVILLSFQLFGELTARAFALSVPGAVLGMFFLFLTLIVRGRVPKTLDDTVPRFLAHLTLFFIPASVGVISLGPLLRDEGGRILLVMVLSTVAPLLACAWLLDWRLRRRGARS